MIRIMDPGTIEFNARCNLACFIFGKPDYASSAVGEIQKTGSLVNTTTMTSSISADYLAELACRVYYADNALNT